MRERFANKVVCSHLKAEQFIDLFLLRGEKNHRHVGLLAQTTKRLHPVHARHLDVEDGKIRWTELESIERGRTVRVSHDTIAFGLESDRNRGQNIMIVVDESDG